MGNGQIAQQLRASSFLSEDHGWVPSAQPSVASVSGNQMLSSDVCGHCIHMVHRHTQNKTTHTQKTKINLFLKGNM